jgi:hypothetical protein
LLPQHEVFHDQFPVTAERQSERADDHDQQFQHAADRGWCWSEIQLARVVAMDSVSPTGLMLLICSSTSSMSATDEIDR